jgi:hypothetical protein
MLGGKRLFPVGLAWVLVAGGVTLGEGPTRVDPVAWQKAGVGLELTSTISGKVGDNADWVLIWADSSGHENRMELLYPTKCPRLITTPAERLNGHPILGFGTGQGTSHGDPLGSSNSLLWQVNPLHRARAATGFIVVRVFDTNGGGQVWNFGGNNAENPWATSGPPGSASSTSAELPFIWDNFGSTRNICLINEKWCFDMQPPEPFRPLPFVRFGQWYIYSVTLGPEDGDVVMKGYINGILKGKRGGINVSWNRNPLVGDFGYGKTVMNVAEILLYDRVLTPSERNAVTAYLGEKFGICVAPPAFEPEGGVYKQGQTVRISCATPGATIRYTTDGSDPSETSGKEIASGKSLDISSDTILKARAYSDELPASFVNKAFYTLAPVPTRGLTSWAKSGFGVTFDSRHKNWVTGWMDASGNEKHLVRGSWAGNPLYKPDTLGGQPVLGFGKGQGTTTADELYYIGTSRDGRYGFIREASSPLVHATAGTGFIVVQAFLNNKNPPYGGQVWDLGRCGSAPNIWNPPEIYENFGATSRPLLIKDPTLEFGQWYIYAVSIGGEMREAVMKGYINGKLKGTAGALTVSFYEVAIGDHNPVAKNETSVINVAELLLYDRVLTDAEMETVTAYLGKKFGIPYR